MNRLAAAIALALTLGLPGSSFAQSGGSSRTADQPAPISGSPRSSSAATAAGTSGANAMMGMKAQELIGRDVVNASGKDIGEIDDIVINEQDQVLYAVIGVGGFLGLGEKEVAIPFEQLRLGADNVILMSERSEADLKQMPSYRKGQWKSVEPDRALGGR